MIVQCFFRCWSTHRNYQLCQIFIAGSAFDINSTCTKPHSFYSRQLNQLVVSAAKWFSSSQRSHPHSDRCIFSHLTLHQPLSCFMKLHLTLNTACLSWQIHCPNSPFCLKCKTSKLPSHRTEFQMKNISKVFFSLHLSYHSVHGL